MAEDIKDVLRNAGYSELKRLITYNSHVEGVLNMGEGGGEILIPDEVNSSIKAKVTQYEKAEHLLNHIRHSFDLEWLKKFAEVLVGDPGDKQNKKAGRMILDALTPVETRPIPQGNGSVSRHPQAVADPVNEITAFLRQNYEKFMNDVVAKAIAMELHHRDIILEEVRTKIERALSAREANGHLYDHLCSSATWERLELFCKVLMSEDNEGCARMKELGVEMLKIITKENKIVSSKSE